ncbi:MAG: stage II sporulation protein M [Gammaproteobacteria bacterium]|nr:stage II sporulation protein M [Gammaproteobacteria bacterium]
MRQEQFEALYGERWQAFEDWLAHRELPRRKRQQQPAPLPSASVPRHYREICRHLALARARDYGTALVARLHRLAVAGHDVLYGAASGFWTRALAYLGGGFAADVRVLKTFVLVSALLLTVPYAAIGIATRLDPDFAYLVLPPERVWEFEEMYSTNTEHLGRTRDAGTDVQMFGFYIYNNIGIAFRCYAGGALAGLGSAAALLSNGVFMGAAEGRIVAKGYGENFYSFVVGHSAFELFAIVLSGACGLRLGWALIAPGRRSRAQALKQAAHATAGVMAGAAVMLLIAAGIEAFWSPIRFAPAIKYSVGIGLISAVAAYFLFAGRTHADR